MANLTPEEILRAIINGSITEIDNSQLTLIRDYKLYGCTSLGEIDLTNVTNIGNFAFYGCTSIEKVNVPNNAISGRNSVFRQCTSLTEIKIPKCTLTYGLQDFSGCSALEVIAFPSAERLHNQELSGCTSLSIVDVGAGCTIINNGNFDSDTSLKTIILRKKTIVSLSLTNNFNRTPFGSGGSGGKIYIPQTLYEHLGDGSSLDYQSATNWSTVYGYGTITWAKIEGSQYEHYWADGTPIE